MRASARFPRDLWPEICRAAVYLYNLSPQYGSQWKTPFDVFHTQVALMNGISIKDQKPQIGHLKVYGCRAYAMTTNALKKENRLERFNPKAWIGYLVGYSSTNIYKIWNPKTGAIVRVRDVIFDESRVFSGHLLELEDELLGVSVEELARLLLRIDVSNNPEYINDLDEEIEDATFNQDRNNEHTTTQGSTGSESEEPSNRVSEDSSGPSLTVGERLLDGIDKYAYPTPPESPPSALLAGSLTIVQDNDPTLREGSEHAAGMSTDGEGSAAALVQEATNREGVAGALIGENIGEGSAAALNTRDSIDSSQRTRGKHFLEAGSAVSLKKSREGVAGAPTRTVDTVLTRCRDKLNPWRTAFLAGTRDRQYKLQATMTGDIYDHERLTRQVLGGRRLQSFLVRDLPPAPKTHRDVESHPLGLLFQKAEIGHLDSHDPAGSWTEVPQSEAREKQILDCMWVYVYKADKKGRLVKCKARLVARGDQEKEDDMRDTYAATLAARSFRTLMSICARFGLEIKGFDAVNAFVNAKIDEEMYMKMPPGYRKRGLIYRINKAIYGLRRSPLLWQEELTGTLKDLGFKAVPHEPCYMLRSGIILFFYVDDIVLAYKKEREAEANEIMARLRKKYNITGGEDLDWFLGMRIVRDREKKLIWLSQATYIDKIAKLVDSHQNDDVPMSREELLPYEGTADYSSIHKYQRKVGSIMYTAVSTRPDVAFAVSRLARFLTNPGPKHHKAADKVLSYLRRFRTYALKLGGGDDYTVSTDASFGDNTLDRKSSQAYVMTLFGGTIGWQANKQDTVTTSTTEAELLALAQGVKEGKYILRLLLELDIRFQTPTLHVYCDNKQTLGLLEKDAPRLRTKLRHVDIHNHWVRQEVQKGDVQVHYMPTKDMIANGLTKALSKQEHQIFLNQIGVENIDSRLAPQQKDIENPDIEELLSLNDMPDNI
ncbi:hypothetical protein EYB26_001151 [Talaromyces marneffei]|nr:uncharacterized protein EYB26_001151 [Talaromyces marneffei]QGA13501.1 hypothetical protein EYB26_001151 [Talaromyces marneffei]